MSNGVSDSSAVDNTMDATMQTPEKLDKGKGKMAPQDDSMGEGDSEESEEDEEVHTFQSRNTKQSANTYG